MSILTLTCQIWHLSGASIVRLLLMNEILSKPNMYIKMVTEHRSFGEESLGSPNRSPSNSNNSFPSLSIPPRHPTSPPSLQWVMTSSRYDIISICHLLCWIFMCNGMKIFRYSHGLNDMFRHDDISPVILTFLTPVRTLSPSSPLVTGSHRYNTSPQSSGFNNLLSTPTERYDKRRWGIFSEISRKYLRKCPENSGGRIQWTSMFMTWVMKTKKVKFPRIFSEISYPFFPPKFPFQKFIFYDRIFPEFSADIFKVTRSRS